MSLCPRTKLLVCSASVALMFAACVGVDDDSDFRTDEVEEIIDNLVWGGIDEEHISVRDDVVYMDGDIQVTLKASEAIAQRAFRQYSIYEADLVTVQKICITIDPDMPLTGKRIPALTAAIANYNDTDLDNDGVGGDLKFTLQEGDNGDGTCDAIIVAHEEENADPGGHAGFPEGDGNPWGHFYVGDGLEHKDLDVGVNTHVITHELGHCIGFRHTDYFNRSISCGRRPYNEGSAGIGAELIENTPSGAKRHGSVMNSCFSSSSTGEWTGTDENALLSLYGNVPHPETENSCDDGIDDDHDGKADCDDADCAAEDHCASSGDSGDSGDPGGGTCTEQGESCRDDGDCCSGNCSNGKPSTRVCL